MPTNEPNQRLISRQLFCDGVRLREAEGDSPSRTIRGYAVVFGTPSVTLWRDGDIEYNEIIEPSAITTGLLDSSDIKLTMYHDRQLLLARSNKGKGTLRYGIDDRGVWFETELPATADGDTARELIARGDLSGCSFMFGCYYDDPECVRIERNETTVTAHVLRIERIYDFTIAADPAYPTTEVNLREAIAARVRAAEEPAPTEEPAPAEEPAPTEEPAPAEEPVPTETDNTTNNTNNPQETMENEPTNNQREEQPRVAPSLTTRVREAFSRSRHCEITFAREGEAGEASGAAGEASGAAADTTTVTTGNEANAANATPATIQGVLEEIEAGLIWHQLGLRVVYNSAGELIWLVPGSGSAKFVGENVAIEPQTIDISKISAKAERLAVMYETTYEALYHTEGIVENVIMKALALAAQRAINKAILSLTKPEGSASIQGPFVAAKNAANKVAIPASFNFKNVNRIKANLLKGGVAQAPCVVLHPSTYCDLEATPKDTGSGIMMIENNKLMGYPCFISDAVDEGYICAGDFSNQAIGFAGDMRLIVDPYSKADKNVIRFVLNFGMLTATLRPDAFVVGKIATN